MILSLAVVAAALAPQSPLKRAPAAAQVDAVDFDRDVRPVLADRCFACHGPDGENRAAGLRLDTREGATADLGGRVAVMPGDPEGSELWHRVTAVGEERMPPADSHKLALNDTERAAVKGWIEQGAPWSKHWAFVPPVRPDVGAGDGHPVDQLLQRALDLRELSRSPRAPVHVLARRLRLDLTGLPPTPAEVGALGDDPSDAAWLAWIDTLLASPEHGERLAMWWLDGARYADTDGFQADGTRSNWPWRDWVVEAFRTNMRFDRFTELQFAGDLLAAGMDEGEAKDAVLATCFHRNHMHNGEGGRDPEESRVDYVRDRTNTMGTVWLGLTLECAQCHDHKFDPVSQADYYSLTAYFNSIDETGQAGGAARPFLNYVSPHAAPAVERAAAELGMAREAQAAVRAAHEPAFGPWLRAAQEAAGPVGWLEPTILDVSSGDGGALRVGDDNALRRMGPAADKDEYTVTMAPPSLRRLTGLEVEFVADEQGRFSDAEDGEFILTGIKVSAVAVDGGSVRYGRWRKALANAEGRGVDKEVRAVAGALNDDPRQGWTTRGAELAGAPRAVFALEDPLDLRSGDRVVAKLLFRSSVNGAYARTVRIRMTEEGGDAALSLGATPMSALRAHVDAAKGVPLSNELRDRLLAQFLDGVPQWREAVGRTRRLEAQQKHAKAAAGELKVTVLRERASPRATFVLERGVWDQRGAAVVAGTPRGVWGGPADEPFAAPSRLALARWITHRNNPLTARVLVNQLWQMLFGRGLVRTPGDFGLQGQRPTHPDILDWLSVELMESGWDVRHLLRTIVTSEAYRQSSDGTPAQWQADPDNLWLARGARFRLPSWMIRDGALAVSGQLDRRVGGPPVFPHQPPGVWEEMFMGRMRYQPTVGEGRFRRSLYAFWRRNVTPTFFFDSADRRLCSVSVRETNTPLHALTVLHDRVFVEAALALALGIREAVPGMDPATRVRALAERVLVRSLTAEERGHLMGVYDAALAGYRADPELAAAAVMPSARDVAPSEPGGDAAELAALAAVAVVVLNLDEVLTRG